jgi:hypothetical protein
VWYGVLGYGVVCSYFIAVSDLETDAYNPELNKYLLCFRYLDCENLSLAGSHSLENNQFFADYLGKTLFKYLLNKFFVSLIY